VHCDVNIAAFLYAPVWVQMRGQMRRCQLGALSRSKPSVAAAAGGLAVVEVAVEAAVVGATLSKWQLVASVRGLAGGESRPQQTAER
jgi:hypothetical protein